MVFAPHQIIVIVEAGIAVRRGVVLSKDGISGILETHVVTEQELFCCTGAKVVNRSAVPLAHDGFRYVKLGIHAVAIFQ